MPDTTTGAVLLEEALKWLGPKEFMRQVAHLVPVDLDRPEDADVYIGYLVERGVLAEVGHVMVDKEGVHPHLYQQDEYHGDLTLQPAYRVVLG